MMSKIRNEYGFSSTREQALEAALRLSIPSWFDTGSGVTSADVLVQYARTIEEYLDSPDVP